MRQDHVTKKRLALGTRMQSSGLLISGCMLPFFPTLALTVLALVQGNMLLPRSQFAKLKVDTFIFYLNGKSATKYDWSRHLLDHYSSWAWFTKHISALEKPASSV